VRRNRWLKLTVVGETGPNTCNHYTQSQKISEMSLCCEVTSSFVIFAALDLPVGGHCPQKVS